jgi:hypothetical protein
MPDEREAFDGPVIVDWFQGNLEDGSPTLVRITDDCWIDPSRLVAVTKCEDHDDPGHLFSTSHIWFRDGFMINCALSPTKVVGRIAEVMSPVG